MGLYDQTDMGGTVGTFLTTHWSLIEGVQKHEDPDRALIGLLLERYWKPVYCYVRRRGHANEEAKDIAVQRLETTVAVAVEPLDQASEDVLVDASNVDRSASAEPERDALPDSPNSGNPDKLPEYRCAFCGRRGGPFTRLGFVGRGYG